MSKLLAIDGLSILRTIFEANPEKDLEKRAGAALDTGIHSFGKLLGTHKPTHVLPAFDAGGVTWRHELYPQYRQGRTPMPEELQSRIPEFMERLERMGLHPLRIPGVEADDVIATGIVRWTSEQRGDAIIATSDKDLHQLVEFGALVWDHFRGEWHDAAWVEKKFGVHASQLGDYLALVGDRVDNIPGVDRIGKTTAAKLLQRYGSLEGVMSGAGILLDNTGKWLRQGKGDLEVSRRLVTLKTDVKLGVTWKMLAMPSAQ